MPRWKRFREIAVLLLAGALLSRCSSCVTDPDGLPVGATTLAIDRPRSDGLDCSGDCEDWYRTPVSEAGTLMIRVASHETSGPPPAFHVELYRPDLRPLDSAIGRPGGSARVNAFVPPGSYLSRVRIERGSIGYEIQARLVRPRKPEPPEAEEPPPPRYRDVTARVVEMEGRPPSVVLIDQGSADGLRRGQRGQLVDGERTLAEIEILEAFPEGSRARLLERLRGVVSPETRAVIRVPVQ